MAAAVQAAATSETAPLTAKPEAAPATFPPPKTDKPRPHVCATCQRSFARLEHLKRHERSHTKEKPFECPECARCFARRDLLLRHQQKLHQTTTPSSRPRNRRESTTGVAPGQSRARKNSTAAAANGVRPRANTISHVEAAKMLPMNAANLAMARGIPATHSRHPSLMGLPMGNVQHSYMGMSGAIEQRGMAHGLPKLETDNLSLDFSGGLRTAPPVPAYTGPDFDFAAMMFGNQGNTINPNALHYSDSPPSMALDPMAPFPLGFQDTVMGHQYDDLGDFLPGFDQQLSFHHIGNENAVDESSPSAMSTGEQSGVSELMMDGTNQNVAAALTSSIWQPSIMPPPQLNAPFNMDMSGAVFPDLLSSAPISPLPSQSKAGGEGFFSTPPASSPSVASGLNGANLKQMSSFVTGPETPTSISGTTQGISPVATISDATRSAVLAALVSNVKISALTGRTPTVHGPTSSPSPKAATQPGEDATATATDSTSVLPTTTDLQRFVSAYIRFFHPHMPFIHLPTLSFDLAASHAGEAVEGPACLLLSMTAIGALYEMKHDKSKELFELAQTMLQSYIEQRRRANVLKVGLRSGGAADPSVTTDDNNDTPLWLVQTMLLNVVYGHNCGDKVAGEIALNHGATLVHLADIAKLLRPQDTSNSTTTSSGMQADGDGTAEWLQWKTGEERKRTLFAIFILSSLLVTSYNHAPALPNSEIYLDLPCDEEFYSAESAAAFQARGGALAASHNQVLFHDSLGQLLRAWEPQQMALSDMSGGAAFSQLKPSTFGCLVLINALHNYIWETRQRHHNKIWTSEETETLHRHVGSALKAWEAAWAKDPHHRTERPNPFGKGPLSADALPLLDLAYVRLFVNLSSSKDKFWRRDWDGVADELARGSDVLQHTSSMNAVPPMEQAGMLSMGGQSTIDVANGMTETKTSANSQASHRDSSRREKHLRKAAFYAADSLSMADKLGVTFADLTSRELPLQSAMCAFDCAQVLAEWVATLQDRVGRYLGILGQAEVDLTAIPAIMLLEDEDVKLLAKIQEILTGAQIKMNVEPATSIAGLESSFQMQDYTGYAAKLLRVTAFMLDRAAVWPVTHLMAQCLETHATRMKARAEQSVVGLTAPTM